MTTNPGHGGPRRGAGRRPGTVGVRKTREAADIAKAQEIISTAFPGAFEGDAYLFLSAIYKNPENPLPIRMKAAETVLGYERPKLAAVEHSGNAEKPLGIMITSGVPRDEEHQDEPKVVNGTGRASPH